MMKHSRLTILIAIAAALSFAVVAGCSKSKSSKSASPATGGSGSGTGSGSGSGTGSGTGTGTGTATISFATDIVPIFAAQGCTGCHGDAGGLTLTGTAQEIYDELVTENPDTRVNTTTPDQSIILTSPLVGSATPCEKAFADTNDPDYLKILQWITEGAQNN